MLIVNMYFPNLGKKKKEKDDFMSPSAAADIISIIHTLEHCG